MRKSYLKKSFGAVLFYIFVLSGIGAMAHCDTMEGPVVKAAKEALASGDINAVLIWVKPDNETEIKDAFQKTLSVRKLNPEVRELADMYFFETVVRVHRAGEGAPYTGLKEKDSDLGPAIPAADKTIQEANVEPLVKMINEMVTTGIEGKFKDLLAKKNFNKADVKADREFVEQYVSFIHYVERIYQAATKPSEGHYEEE